MPGGELRGHLSRKTLKFSADGHKMKSNIPAEREAVRLLFFRL
jgi:hypothetical protein